MKFIKPHFFQVDLQFYAVLLSTRLNMISILVITSGALPECGCLLNSAVPLIIAVKVLEFGKGAE